MRSLRLTLIVAAALLQGCAYLTTFKADLGNPDVGVSIDAKQRVVLMGPEETEVTSEVLVRQEGVNEKAKATPPADADIAKPGASAPHDGASTQTLKTVTKKQRRICAEPSPDALAAISASVGASFITDPASSKQLSAALSESASNIGLRTTSIQLMRDAMYRVCEAYLSGGIDQETYADLQAHSQSLIVGLLAIEQLTSAVVARQGSITTSAAAGGLPEVSDAADALSKAKKKTADQKVVLDKAAAARGAAEDAVKAKKAALEAIDASETDKVATAERELKEANEKVQPLKEAESAADAQLAVFKLAEETAQKVFDVARSRVDAKASGTASFIEGEKRGSSTGVSKETAAVVAPAVALIVTTVMQQSVMSQKCLKVMSQELPKLTPGQEYVLTQHCANLAIQLREAQQGLVVQLGEAIKVIKQPALAQVAAPDPDGAQSEDGAQGKDVAQGKDGAQNKGAIQSKDSAAAKGAAPTTGAAAPDSGKKTTLPATTPYSTPSQSATQIDLKALGKIVTDSHNAPQQ